MKLGNVESSHATKNPMAILFFVRERPPSFESRKYANKYITIRAGSTRNAFRRNE